MSATTTNTPIRDVPTPSELELLIVISDISSLSQSCIGDLAVLFAAILRMSDDPKIHSLVGSANYLAEDWQRLIAEEAEPYEQRRNALLEGRAT